MADNSDFGKTIDDISLLYELSLSIGRSLDLKSNCAEFLKALMARKNLALASVWIKNKHLPEVESDKGASLIYTQPGSRIRETDLPLNHPLFRSLQRKKYTSLTSLDAGYKKVVTEKGIRRGTFAIFSLNDLGAVKLFSSARKERFEKKELSQLSKVITKFAVSLEGCLAYQKARQEVFERQRAEETLRQERDFSRSLLQASPTFFVAISADGKILMMNEIMLKTMGYTRGEVLGTDYLKTFVPNADRERIALVFKRMVELHQPSMDHNSVLTRDGGERLVEWHDMPMFKKNGEFDFFFGIGIDITERRRMEEELFKASKLESLGIMAGGIAHDFNNILTGILGNISLARMEMDPKKIVIDRLREAEKATLRAKNLTQQLLTFSRGGTPVKKITLITEFLPEVIDFALSGSNVTYKLIIPDDLQPVAADIGQISQVIENLIINAAQSMPEGGTITVRAENIVLGEPVNIPLKKGKYIKLSVNDHGIGIRKEHLTKVFDPFFTTKQKGSGLGLTSAYSIAKNHDGLITVVSQLNRGTTFSVYLPASPGVIRKKGKVKKREFIPRTGKILIIDDEEVVRDVAGRFMKHIGYQTKTADGGEKGIFLYKSALKQGCPYDAVILDLTMPGGMGGKAAAKKIRALDRQAKIIASSGYSTDPIMSNFKKFGFDGALAKPYQITELSEVLERVIGSR